MTPFQDWIPVEDLDAESAQCWSDVDNRIEVEELNEEE